MPQKIDALFISYFADVDRWHNDDADDAAPNTARTRAVITALADSVSTKDEMDIVVDGRLYDFSRFLSCVRYGTAAEHRRYDPFNITLLAGTYYLSLLCQRGYDVRVANAVDRQLLKRLVTEYEPRFVLLSTTLLFDAADRALLPAAITQIRALWPNAVIVLGGLMLVSYSKNFPRQGFLKLLQSYNADVYVVSPRGEQPMLEILRRGSLDAILKGPRIANTYVRSGREVLVPDDFVEPADGLASNQIRWAQLPQTGHLYHTVHLRTARSCAFQCAFCEYPVNQGPLTLAPVDVVDQELGELKALGSVRSIVFTDDTFNVPLRRFKELLRVLRKYNFEWYSFFRPQYADDETARLMKEAGCRAVFAGLEFVDDQVLHNMHKVAKADAYRRGIEQLMKSDIRVHANFIVGFPGETEQSAGKIVPFLEETGIEFCTVCPWAFIPSTPIGKRKHEFGLEGAGYRWRHSTMTSVTAQSLTRQIVNERKYAIHNAVRGEAWTEFLLYANGFSVNDVRLAIQAFNNCAGRDMAEAELQNSPEYGPLKALLTKHEMPVPRLC